MTINLRYNSVFTDRYSKIDNIVSPIILGILLFILVIAWSKIALNMGLSSADDAFFAVVAKMLTKGVYGLPISSHQVSQFDPSIGVGPVLIALGALVTYLFAPTDALGVCVVGLFVIQLACVIFTLSRKYSLAEVSGFAFVFVIFLILVSKKQQFFSSFIGEVPTLGFLLIGSVLLLSSKDNKGYVIGAGLSFSAAYLTKQIALFSIIGMVFCWYLISIFDLGLRDASKKFISLSIVIVLPPVLFELAKLGTLGVNEYINLIESTARRTKIQAVGIIHNRPERLVKILSDSYEFTKIICAVALILFSLFIWRGKKSLKSLYFMAMLWSGTLTYLIYISFFSIMWPRYFWIGLGSMAFASSVPILTFVPRLRWISILFIVLAFGSTAYSITSTWVDRSAQLKLSDERRKILIELENSPYFPLAGRSWHSLYDLVYLLPQPRVWVTEGGLNLIHNEPFIAVLNEQFGDKKVFYATVRDGCSVQFSGERYSLHVCGAEFWSTYEARVGP